MSEVSVFLSHQGTLGRLLNKIWADKIGADVKAAESALLADVNAAIPEIAAELKVEAAALAVALEAKLGPILEKYL